MRFLKKKIASALLLKEQSSNKEHIVTNLPEENPKLIISFQESLSIEDSKRKRASDSPITPQATRETKNIVKNYGKAICKFCISSLAFPYLKPFIQNEGVTLQGFLDFVKKAKRSIQGLSHFRAILLPDENDDKRRAAYKKIFKLISEVFIKYFSVNWIFASKLKYKTSHLKFRFKLLRRIRSPELFTYLMN